MEASVPADLLSGICRHAFVSLIRRENDWVLSLDNGAQVFIECLWRLVEAGRVQITSQDHDQQFGLPTPLDAAAEVNRRLAAKPVEQAKLQAGTLDLELHFEHDLSFQIIPDSSGYEAWRARVPTAEFIATGGGEMVIRPAR
jgi:hypothetical protein